MAKDKRRPIIIKRNEGEDTGDAHGGAWKIAYADFVTAMMAFFLLMWLLNSTTEERRRGIAEFFNPMADKTVQMPTNQILKEEPSPLTGGKKIKDLQDKEREDTKANIEKEPASQNRERSDEGEIAKIVPIGSSDKEANAAYRSESERINNFIKNINNDIKNSEDLRDYRDNIAITYSRDDVRIELKDSDNKSMFDLGSSSLNNYGKKLLGEISAYLMPMSEKISIVGYTDRAPYHMGRGWSMSNWTLSALRADHAREQLVRSGYPDSRVIAISGRADRDLAFPDDPTDSSNRRVVIIMHRRSINK